VVFALAFFEKMRYNKQSAVSSQQSAVSSQQSAVSRYNPSRTFYLRVFHNSSVFIKKFKTYKWFMALAAANQNVFYETIFDLKKLLALDEEVTFICQGLRGGRYG
jgi:hypothetical protein